MKWNRSPLISLVVLALLAASGLKSVGRRPAETHAGADDAEPTRDVKGVEASAVSGRAKSPLVWCVAVLVIVGCIGYARRFAKSESVAAAAPPQQRQLPPRPLSVANPLTVKVGFLPKRIYDLDSSKGSFSADFYVWLKYDKSVPDPSYLDKSDSGKGVPNVERLEAENGEPMESDRQDYTPADKPEYRVWYRTRGKFYHDFDIHDFPFDEQVLEIRLENPLYSAAQFQYVIDEASGYSSRQADGSSADLDPGLICVSGWETKRIQHVVKVNHYPTDWGLPGEPELRDYSQSSLIITLKRRSGQHLAQMVLPLLAAALLVTLVFFHSSKDLSAAIWICVAMFISVVGHHRGLLTAMPDVRYFITSDLFFLLTYLYIVTCLMMLLVTDYYSRNGRELSARRVCCRSRVILPVFYLLLMSAVASPALNL